MLIHSRIINSAIEYIHTHIMDEISVDTVADYCGFSKFYLERAFKEKTGESIYEYIKRLKVEQSAFRLKVEKQKQVTQIGSDYGYSPSNYATVFKSHFGESPVEFRKTVDQNAIFSPFMHGKDNQFESFEECEAKITVEELPDYFVMYERFKGNYHNLIEDWCLFQGRNKEFITEKTIFIERTNDDPSITDKDLCFYDICMTVDKNDERLYTKSSTRLNAKTSSSAYATTIITGGLFAVYHYQGYPQQIYKSYQSVFTSWLSKKGYQLDQRYSFDIYKSVDQETLFLDMMICIPIKKI